MSIKYLCKQSHDFVLMTMDRSEEARRREREREREGRKEGRMGDGSTVPFICFYLNASSSMANRRRNLQ